MRTRFQSGRVRGYQPTLNEFNDLLELSQRGIDEPDSTAELIYQQGSNVTTSDKGVRKVTAESLSELIKESGETRHLINLEFSANQESPHRSVRIHIHPDGWTYYGVESSDFTWALGRFHELTEMLLANRRLPAKVKFPLPEVVTPKQEFMSWGTPFWSSTDDWRITLVKLFKDAPFWFPFLVVVAFTASPPSSSLAHTISLASLTLAYAAFLFGYYRWLQATFRSNVSMARSQLNIRSLVIDKEAEPVDRGILLVTVVGVLVSILTLIVDALH
jgi:hypothetical protein